MRLPYKRKRDYSMKAESQQASLAKSKVSFSLPQGQSRMRSDSINSLKGDDDFDYDFWELTELERRKK